MGYTTEFSGRFILNKPLAPNHLAYLKAFTGSRESGRDVFRHMQLHTKGLKPDPLSKAVGLPVGDDGLYYVWQQGDTIAEVMNKRIKQDDPPGDAPSRYCQWVPSDDGRGFEWIGWEKFYKYEEWIVFLIKHFLKPWGYTVNGRVLWYGEDHVDVGLLIVEDNVVRTENLIDKLQLTL